MLRAFSLALVAAGVLGACSSAGSAQAPPTPAVASPNAPSAERRRMGAAERRPSPDAVSRLIQDALRADGDIPHQSLIERLGSPQRVETESVANQYVPDQVDTLRTLLYGGLEVLLYDVANKPRSFLVRLSLSSARYTTPEGIQVGLREARVREMLGPPTRRNAAAGRWIYEASDPTPTSMIIQMQNGQVSRIDWEFYVA